MRSVNDKRQKNAYYILFSLLFIICLSTASCAHKTAEKTFFAMDTVMTVKAVCDEKDLIDIEVLVNDLETSLSVTPPDSEISMVNTEKSGKLSADTANLITRALKLCEQTDGNLDISVYPFLKLWGFAVADKNNSEGDEIESTDTHTVPSDEMIAEALKYVDYRRIIMNGNNVILPEGAQIDLGAVAKGYTGDRIIDALKEKGIKNALLNLGGNIQALGSRPDGKPWKVAIAAPDKDGYALTLDISDLCVITSGGYERYFEQDGVRYIHIIDPHTGYPVNNGLASVTVVGKSGLECDAYSTALFVMGLERGTEFWRTVLCTKADPVDLIFITEDGKIFITEGLEGNYALTGVYGEDAVTVIHH